MKTREVDMFIIINGLAHRGLRARSEAVLLTIASSLHLGYSLASPADREAAPKAIGGRDNCLAKPASSLQVAEARVALQRPRPQMPASCWMRLEEAQAL